MKNELIQKIKRRSISAPFKTKVTANVLNHAINYFIGAFGIGTNQIEMKMPCGQRNRGFLILLSPNTRSVAELVIQKRFCYCEKWLTKIKRA